MKTAKDVVLDHFFSGDYIVMFFSKNLAFELMAAKNEHLLIGQAYG